MSRLDVLYSSKSDEWSTPKALFDELNEEFGFTLDPCSTENNHLCDKYYTVHENGLEQSWKGAGMIIDYTLAKECKNEEVWYICYKCGKCGRVFVDGFMVDDGGTTIEEEQE